MPARPPSVDKRSAPLKKGAGSTAVTNGVGGKAARRSLPAVKTVPDVLATCEPTEPVLSDQDFYSGLTVIVEPPPSPKPGRLTVQTAERIFKKHVKKALPREEIEALTHELNRPWRENGTHGVWEFHRAVRVILDDAPVVLQAEAHYRSQIARQRKHGYSLMLEGAKILENLGVHLPRTKQAKSRANKDHRDWWRFYWAVRETLAKAQIRGVGYTPGSAAIMITCEMLKVFGMIVSDEALIGMIKERRRRYKSQPNNPWFVTGDKKGGLAR